MAKDKMYGKTLRKNFARHEEIMEMPNLLELQKKSYRWFLDEGLQEVFADVEGLRRVGLDAPAPQRFAAELRKAGFDLPDRLYDVESLAEAIAACLGAADGGGRARNGASSVSAPAGSSHQSSGAAQKELPDA